MSMTTFGEYATNTAFDLKLSKKQVRTLCCLDHSDTLIDGFMTISALRTKGLIDHVGDGWVITPAGKLVVDLLKEANIYLSADDIAKSFGFEVR